MAEVGKVVIPTEITTKLVRVPNADCWVDPIGVIAVRKCPDVVQTLPVDKPGQEPQKITMTVFELRMIDGKAVQVQTPDRVSMSQFLAQIGVDWAP